MRTNFLVYLAAMLIGCSQQHKETLPNPADAKQRIIHIKQMHGIEELTYLNRDDVEKIAQVQKEIYFIISDLVRKYNTRTVYLEGAQDEKLYRTPDSAAHYAQFFWNREMIRLNKARLISDTEVVETARSLDDYLHGESSTLSTLAYYPGGAYLLMLERKITVRPVEQPGVTDAESREDLFVWRIAKDKEPNAIATLGASHSISDNVERHNKQHPNWLIAVTEIVPNTFVKNHR